MVKHLKEGKGCNHTLQDILANMKVEKVREYMIGEDLTAGQDKEIEGSILRSLEEEDKARDRDSLSLEEAEEKSRKGQDPGYELFHRVRVIQEVWDNIQKHLDEGDQCSHRITQIFFDIPMIQQTMKEI